MGWGGTHADPNVVPNIGPPEEDGEGPSPRCSTRSAPRMKWMWMTAKTVMTEVTGKRPPPTKSDGEPPKLRVKAWASSNLWWAESVYPPGNLDDGVSEFTTTEGCTD